MKIEFTEKDLFLATGVKCSAPFNVSRFGLLPISRDTKPSILFVESGPYLSNVENLRNFDVLITDSDSVSQDLTEALVIRVDDARWVFYSCHNFVANKNRIKEQLELSETAEISSKAIIAKSNVKIGDRTVVEPGAIILENVEIGKNCIIRAGAVIGTEGFEFKKTSKGILSVIHYGKVIIGDNVEIGSNSTIAKGLDFERNTSIGNNTKIDANVFIAHGCNIGNSVFIIASSEISGSVSIGDHAWIAPNASIRQGIKIGKGALVGIGSVVIRDVPDNAVVYGVPAKEKNKKI